MHNYGSGLGQGRGCYNVKLFLIADFYSILFISGIPDNTGLQWAAAAAGASAADAHYGDLTGGAAGEQWRRHAYGQWQRRGRFGHIASRYIARRCGRAAARCYASHLSRRHAIHANHARPASGQSQRDNADN